MTATTLGLLVLYLGGTLAIGVAAHRRGRKTGEDYFLASRSVGLWLLVGTIVATLINGLAVTGTPALLYEGGVLFGQMFVVVGGSMALMWTFGPRICRAGQENGYVTLGDLFGSHYRSRLVLGLTAVLGMLSIIPFLAIQLVGIGKVLAATTGGSVPQEAAVLLCVVFIGIYVFLGGARASVWTDALQGLIALVAFTAFAVLFSTWVGGVPAGVEKLQRVMPEKLVFDAVSTPIFVDNVLSWTFAFFLWPHVFQRMFMARTPGGLRRSARISLVVFSYVLVCLLVMSIAATADLYGTLDDPDQLIAALLRTHFPIGGALLTVLVFALTMSTVDSMLLALGSSVDRYLWRGLLGRETSAREGFTRGRWATLALLLLSSLFAITAVGRGAITPWVTLGASIATLFVWPFLGIFVWRGTTTPSVVAAMLLGFLAICVARFTPVGKLLPIGFATAGFLVAGLSFLGMELLNRSRTTQQS